MLLNILSIKVSRRLTKIFNWKSRIAFLWETSHPTLSPHHSSKVPNLFSISSVIIIKRLGAAHAVLEICGPKPQDNGSLQKKENFQLGKVQYIVDCTLAYHKGIVPHFGCCLLGLWPTDKSMTVAIHYKIHPVRQEWCSNQELFKKWLYEQYRQKVWRFPQHMV